MCMCGVCMHVCGGGVCVVCECDMCVCVYVWCMCVHVCVVCECMCVNVCMRMVCVCAYMCVYMRTLVGEEAVGSPEARVMRVYEVPCGC